MGIHTSAVIAAGLPFGEFTDEDRRDELIEVGELEVISPYYDADLENCIIGVTVASTGRYKPAELELDLIEVMNLKGEFFKLTGESAKLYLSPLVR